MCKIASSAVPAASLFGQASMAKSRYELDLRIEATLSISRTSILPKPEQLHGKWTHLTE